MFGQLKKIDNESGIVLFMVLMTSFVIMIFSVGILTQSINEINYAQQQIDQITSDQWAKGYFWNQYATTVAANSSSLVLSSQGVASNITGRNYVMNIVQSGSGYLVSANYDTF